MIFSKSFPRPFPLIFYPNLLFFNNYFIKITKICFMLRFYFIHFIVPICCVFFLSCTNKQQNIFYINSYHQGYPSGDSILAGIKYVLNDKKPELQTVYMDTKCQQGKDHIRKKVNQILGKRNSRFIR